MLDIRGIEKEPSRRQGMNAGRFFITETKYKVRLEEHTKRLQSSEAKGQQRLSTLSLQRVKGRNKQPGNCILRRKNSKLN